MWCVLKKSGFPLDWFMSVVPVGYEVFLLNLEECRKILFLKLVCFGILPRKSSICKSFSGTPLLTTFSSLKYATKYGILFLGVGGVFAIVTLIRCSSFIETSDVNLQAVFDHHMAYDSDCATAVKWLMIIDIMLMIMNMLVVRSVYHIRM